MSKASAKDQEILLGLSRNNRKETQKKTPGIEGNEGGTLEKTSGTETSVIQGISDLSGPSTKESSEGLNKENEGVSVVEMTDKEPEKLTKSKAKKVNAGNKGIVEKLKREITRLNEIIAKMTIEYEKVDEKNKKLENVIETTAKELDDWRNKYRVTKER